MECSLSLLASGLAIHEDVEGDVLSESGPLKKKI